MLLDRVEEPLLQDGLEARRVEAPLFELALQQRHRHLPHLRRGERRCGALHGEEEGLRLQRRQRPHEEPGVVAKKPMLKKPLVKVTKIALGAGVAYVSSHPEIDLSVVAALLRITR